MNNLIDPLIQIKNLTPDAQSVSWRVTAVDINGHSLTPIANDTGTTILQPGGYTIQRFDWIKISTGIGFNVVTLTSIDQTTHQEQITSIAQSVYPDDYATLKSTGLFADITPDEIILSSKITSPIGNGGISLSVFLGIIFSVFAVVLILVLCFIFRNSWFGYHRWGWSGWGWGGWGWWW